MTERPQDGPRPGGAPASHDPTRDIRLPPLPDRPPPAMPPAWAGLSSPPASDGASPDFSAPPPALSTEADTAVEPAAPAPPRGFGGLAHGPTDRLAKPGQPPRERTLAFSSSEMTHRPAAPVQVARTPRRWPWIVLMLLPILIIAGTGITLVLMFQAG